MALRDKGDQTSQGPKIFRFWNVRENLIPKTAKPWRPKIGSAVWSVVWVCTFVSYLGQHGQAWLPSPFLITQCSICFPIWSAWLCTMPWLANYTFLTSRVTKEAIQPPLVHPNHQQQTVHYCKGAYIVNHSCIWNYQTRGIFLRFEIGLHWLKQVCNFPKIKHSSIWQILRSFLLWTFCSEDFAEVVTFVYTFYFCSFLICTPSVKSPLFSHNLISFDLFLLIF